MAPVKKEREGRPRKRPLEHGSAIKKTKESPESQTIRIPKSAMFDSIRLPTIQFSDSQPPIKKIRVASFDLTTPKLISKHDDDVGDVVDDPNLHDAILDFDDQDDGTTLEATMTTAKSATTIKDKSNTTSKDTHKGIKDEPKRKMTAVEARRAKRMEATTELASDSKQLPFSTLAAQETQKEPAAIATATAEPASDSTQPPVNDVATAAAATTTIKPASDSTQPLVKPSTARKTKKAATKPPPVSARAAREAKKSLASTTIGTATATINSTELHAIRTTEKAETATPVDKSANTPMITAVAARKAKAVAETSKIPTSSSTSENQQVPHTDDSDRVPGKIFTSPPPTLLPASSVEGSDDILNDDLEEEDVYTTPKEELDMDETMLEDESQDQMSSSKSEERRRKMQWKEANKLMDPYSVSTFSSDNANPFQHGDETYYCIGLEKGQQLVFLGYSLIGVLYGSVDIGGATISASDDVPTQQISTSKSAKRKVSFFPVFSPKTSALAVVRSIPYAKSATVSPSSTLDSTYSDVKPLLEPYLPILDTLESIIIVKNMEWCGVEELEQINPYMRNLFRFDSKTDLVRNDGHIYDNMVGFQPIINVTPDVRAMKVESSWLTNMDDVLKFEKDHSAASVSMICGTKNVGKSSFARYMINRLLNIHQRVAYLETDVGQTEFTPSGLVSLHIVETPLLGPPFTHPNMKSKRSFFIGSLSPKNDSTYYQDCIHQLLETYRQEAAIGSSNDDDDNSSNDDDINQYQRMPLVVNTSGWIKGLGYDLLLAVAEDVAPTHIFAFGGSEVRPNLPDYFKEQITHAAQQFSNSQFCPAQFNVIQPATITADIQNIPSSASSLQRQRRPITPSTMADKYQAADYRNLMLISYMYHDAQAFGTRQQGRRWWNVNPRLVSRVPWVINWQDLYGVRVLFEDVPPSKLLYALNGSLVGLIGKVNKAAATPSAAADDDSKTENGHMETEEAIDAQEKQESTKVKEATQSRSKSEIPIRYFSPMTSTPPNPSTTTCYGLGIIRSIDPEQRCFYLLTPLPLNQLSHVDTLVKGELDIPVHLLLDQHVGARNQNCGVPWRQVPYLSHDVIDSIGSSAPRVRRNLMRRSQRIE